MQRTPRCRCFNDHNVARRQLAGERRKQIAPHVDAAEPPEPAVLSSHRLAKAAVDIQSNDTHATSSFMARLKTGANGQHDIY
jgi:hypothetical protein